jgi:release factor H-coupled RctB family protein
VSVDRAAVRIVSNSQSWIEGEAVAQLEATARLPGMRAAVGLPDLHAGPGHPIGAAFISELLYPHLVGTDIGCGIGLWQIELNARGFNAQRMVSRLDLDRAWEGDASKWLATRGIEAAGFEDSLGTVGAGNHFVEIQRVVNVTDEGRWAETGIDEARLCLLVHSGSRGLGEAIFQDHLAAHGTRGLDGAGAESYARRHDNAVRWARANREQIAARISEQVDAEVTPILDLTHNSASPCIHDGVSAWLHRKGAAPSDQGLIVIPGSRGTATYLVQPTGDDAETAWSVAHGAGRKWTRRFARERLAERVPWNALQRTALGSVVVCADHTLLYEEAPQAYKDIERVVEDLVEAGLVTPVARLHPVLTYKTSVGSGGRSRKRGHR